MPPIIGIAQWIGEHPLTLLLLVLGLNAGIWVMTVRSARRWHSRRAEARASSTSIARLAVILGLVFACIAGAALVFAAIAAGIDPTHEMSKADQTLADAVSRHLADPALRLFAVLTHLGDPKTLALLGAVVAIALWWRGWRLLAIGWVASLAGNAVLNPLLKKIFDRARPPYDQGFLEVSGSSFPSGHSSGAMVAYGMLLYIALQVLPQRWHVAASIVATTTIIVVACSRVFLRVHFASDVAAGLLSGLAWTGVCVCALEFARHRRQRGASRDA